jgi:hypothetical protein
MKKMLIGAAIVALAATTAYANDQEKRAVGAVGAGTTGAIGGAIIGGPVGAVVGGVVGATIGANAAVPEETRTYVVEHPVDSVTVDGDLTADYVIPQTVVIHPIPDDPDYGYIYVDNRPVVVQLDTRKVVYVR